MLPGWLSLIDVAYICLALFFAWGGSQKGFASQIAHILTCLVMGLILFFVYPNVFSYLGRIFRDLNPYSLMWLILIAMAVLAISVFLLFTKLLTGVLDTDVSPKADSIGGFILGLIRGGMVVLYAMIFLVILGPPKFYDTFRLKSFVGKSVCYEMVPRIQPQLSRSALDERVRGLKDTLRDRDDAGVISF